MTPIRQRMLEDMQVRNLSPHTQRAYVDQVARFARYFRQSPDQLGPEEIRAYLVYLTNERRLAPSSIIIVVAALRFLYTVTLRKPWTVQTVIPAPNSTTPCGQPSSRSLFVTLPTYEHLGPYPGSNPIVR